MCYNYTKYVVKPQNLCGKTFLFFGPGKNFEKFRENLNSYLTYNKTIFLILVLCPGYYKRGLTAFLFVKREIFNIPV
jgi:hypothetical protein